MIVGPKCHDHGITGYGNPNHGVVIIGIAPGQDEIKIGKPLVGKSGQVLDAILDGVGWHRDKVYCTNLICWYKNLPDFEDIAACATRLTNELLTLKPKLVITLGNLVSEHLIGLPMKKIRGRPLYNGSHYIMATYHPAAFLRGSTFVINDIVRDLQKIPIITEWPDNNTIADVRYFLVKKPETAQKVLDELSKDKPTALDIETSSLATDQIDIYADKILSIQISDGTKTWVLTPSSLHNLIWPKDVMWVFHNGMYDTQGLRKYLNVSLPIVEDTMLMSYSVDERKGRHSLDVLTGEYCGSGFYKEALNPYKKIGYENAPKEILYPYGAKDAAYTARLFYILRRFQQEDNVRPFYEDLLIPAANAFSEIQQRGIYIDRERVRELALDWMPRWLTLQSELVEMASESGFPETINLNSHQQLSRLLFNIIGLPGGPSTKKEVLELLVGQHPFIDKLILWRRLDHFITSFIQGVEDDVKVDGRVHPNAFLHGTVTGRRSYRQPPIQTIPKRVEEEFKRVRTIFSATNDNYVLVETDYKTAEIWCGYFYSHDQTMLNDLQSGDYHTHAAAAIYKKPLDKVTKTERTNSKYVSFGLMYGRQAGSLARGELQCSIREAEVYLRNWWNRYPQYEAWSERIKRILLDEGEVSSLTGRKRRYRIVLGNDYRVFTQGVNFPVQSLCGDLTLSSLIELHHKLKAYDSYVLFDVHDSLVFEVNKRYVDQVIKLIQDVMTSPRFDGTLGVPIELSIGSHWGEMDELLGH